MHRLGSCWTHSSLYRCSHQNACGYRGTDLGRRYPFTSLLVFGVAVRPTFGSRFSDHCLVSVHLSGTSLAAGTGVLCRYPSRPGSGTFRGTCHRYGGLSVWQVGSPNQTFNPSGASNESSIQSYSATAELTWSLVGVILGLLLVLGQCPRPKVQAVKPVVCAFAVYGALRNSSGEELRKARGGFGRPFILPGGLTRRTINADHNPRSVASLMTPTNKAMNRSTRQARSEFTVKLSCRVLGGFTRYQTDHPTK